MNASHRWWALAALAVTFAVVLAACGGGGKKTITTKEGDKIQVGGGLPSGFPKELAYPGAKATGSIAGQSKDQSKGAFVALLTGDKPDKVTEYYKNLFSKSPYSLTSQFSSSSSGAQTTMLSFENKAEKGVNGLVTISVGTSGDEKGKTVIGLVYGTDTTGAQKSPTTAPTSSSGSQEETATAIPAKTATRTATLPSESKSLPSGYPADRAPMYTGAVVTSTFSTTSGNEKDFAVSALTKDSPSSVKDFYTSKLKSAGLTEAFSTESNDGILLSYATSDQKTSVTITISLSKESPGLTEISIIVALK